MTDAHCHVSCGDPSVREFLIGRDFVGVHPWDISLLTHPSSLIPSLRTSLSNNPKLGVGEIGLDRLKDKNISSQMRELFEAQLKVALEYHRPVVLHGAKCWGQVVKVISALTPLTSDLRPHPSSLIPSFLFHGFSRSDGLIPDIVKLNGYISVGPSVLNDHAVNYRELVKKIPLDRLLVETDRTKENEKECPSIHDVLAKTAELRGISFAELECLTDANANAFLFP